MIWDRFDDAHDDVLDDMRRIKGEIRDLEEKLKAAGISYPPFEPPSGQDHGGGPHEWYQNTLGEELSLKAYRSALQALLTEGSST